MENEELVTIRCKTCEGPAHPATGCVYSPSFVVCMRCTREAWAWVLNHVNSKGRRGGRPGFYAHVNTIGEPIDIEENAK